MYLRTYMYKCLYRSSIVQVYAVLFRHIRIIHICTDHFFICTVHVLSTHTYTSHTLTQTSNLAVVDLAALHSSVQLAQEGKIDDARMYLQVVTCLMERSAISDHQCEEKGSFDYFARQLDEELWRSGGSGSGKMSDTTLRMILQTKKVNLGQLLASDAKQSVIARRKADESVFKQYYSYRF